MKAVVLEVHKRECAVLKEDGTFARIPGLYQVGETIDLSAERREPVLETSSIVKIILVSAALFASFLGVREYYNVMMPAGYVSFDADGSLTADTTGSSDGTAEDADGGAKAVSVNTGSGSASGADEAKQAAEDAMGVSIEYTLNRRNQVIKVEAVNATAQPTVEKLEEKNAGRRSISDEISRTTKILRESGDISENEKSYVLVSVTGTEEASELVTRQIQDVLADRENVELHVVPSTSKDRDEARKLGLSTGRYREIQEIAARQDEEDGKTRAITTLTTREDIDQYRTKSVRELLIDAKAIEEDKDRNSKAETEEKQGREQLAAETPVANEKKNAASAGSSSSSDEKKNTKSSASPVEIGSSEDDNPAQPRTSSPSGSGKTTSSAEKTTPAPQTGGEETYEVIHPSTEEIGGGTEEFTSPTTAPQEETGASPEVGEASETAGEEAVETDD